jgi:hypothetical protein
VLRRKALIDAVTTKMNAAYKETTSTAVRRRACGTKNQGIRTRTGGVVAGFAGFAVITAVKEGFRQGAVWRGHAFALGFFAGPQIVFAKTLARLSVWHSTVRIEEMRWLFFLRPNSFFLLFFYLCSGWFKAWMEWNGSNVVCFWFSFFLRLTYVD